MLFCFHRFLPVILVLLLAGNSTGLFGQNSAEAGRPVSSLPLSPVILAERPSAIQDYTADPAQVKQMIYEALLTLTSAPNIATAWTRLGITPQDIVGIKITTAGGQAMCTHHAVVRAICDGLREAGVPSAQIIIWDKYQEKMRPAGYLLRTATTYHANIASIVPANFYDPNVYYKNYTVGNLMWGDYQFLNSLNGGGDDNTSDSVANLSYYTKFMTTACTKIINVPVLTDNSYVGINGCLASLALGSVDNNRRFQGPPTYGDPAICQILDQKFIRRKVVVHILDALVAQCAGGPAFNPQYCQSLGAIYVSRDPVAIDTLALPRLERMRYRLGVPLIGNAANHVKDAAYYQLGTNDRRRIQLIGVQ